MLVCSGKSVKGSDLVPGRFLHRVIVHLDFFVIIAWADELN